MMTVVVGLLVVLGPLLALVALLRAVDAWHRRRERVIARQILLTDAVHAEFGAVVAPVVEKSAFQPWRVIYAIADGRAPEAGRLVAIAHRVLARELPPAEPLQIVFTRPAHAA